MVSDVYNTGKGFAFVTFDRKENAETATMAMDGQTLGGQQIKVSLFVYLSSDWLLLSFNCKAHSFIFGFNVQAFVPYQGVIIFYELIGERG